MIGHANLVKQPVKLGNAAVDLLGQVARVHGGGEWVEDPDRRAGSVLFILGNGTS